MSYSTLVDRLLAIPELKTQIDAWDNTHTLNLVTPQWKQCLENNPLYQDFQNHAKTMFQRETAATSMFTTQKLFQETFDLLVVAKCGMFLPFEDKLTKKKSNDVLAVFIKESEPFAMFAEAMASDLDLTKVELSTCHRVVFNACSNMICSSCNKAYNFFLSRNIDVNAATQPCILNTVVYDGTSVLNRFATTIRQTMMTEFLAVLKIRVNQRYFYYGKDNDDATKRFVRMGGTAFKMLALKEAHLSSSDTLCLGEPALEPKKKPASEEEIMNTLTGGMTGDMMNSLITAKPSEEDMMNVLTATCRKLCPSEEEAMNTIAQLKQGPSEEDTARQGAWPSDEEMMSVLTGISGESVPGKRPLEDDEFNNIVINAVPAKCQKMEAKGIHVSVEKEYF